MVLGKPVICVTLDSNKLNAKPGDVRQMICPKHYFAAVSRAGGVPVGPGEFNPEELAELCDGLFLTGGDDIQPERYGETAHTETIHTDEDRDAFEFPLIKAFIEKKKPIYGVCRGIQVVAVAFGGSVYQDLVEDCGIVHMDRRLRHTVKAEPGTFFYENFGETFKTNSTHHQAVKDPGKGMKVICRSLDGSIEAIQHESLPIMASQFHPERMTGDRWDGTTQDFKAVFEHFVQQCKDYAAQHQ